MAMSIGSFPLKISENPSKLRVNTNYSPLEENGMVDFLTGSIICTIGMFLTLGKGG
jgi:hypothetical protein